MLTTALRAQNLVASIGVNTHLAEPGTGPGYMSAATVLSQLQYLGLTHVRELLPGSVSPQQTAEANALATAGIKLDVLIPGNGAVDLKADMALLDAFAIAHPGAIASIEGPNEIDLWPITYLGKSGIAAAVAFQHDLYAAVHADPLLAGLPVYNFTLGSILPADAGVGNVAATADAATVHAYAPAGLRPSWVIPAAIQGFAADVPNKPTVVTETGYYTLPTDSNWGGVSETVQAVYSLDTALDDFRSGISFTYFYELEDAGTSSNREDHFGMFRADGSPKPFATALHNLTTLLADPSPANASFKPGSIDVSFGNLPWTASSTVLQKSTGAFDVVVWDEQALWDPVAHKALPAATGPIATPVTMHLGIRAASVIVYDPILGTAPIATYTDTQDIALPLSNDPLIIEITPTTITPSATALITPTPAPAPTPTPPPPIVLHPAISIITGLRNGTVTLAGTAPARSSVSVTDTMNGVTKTVGTVTTDKNGAWSLTTHARLDTSTINSFKASAVDSAGHTGAMNGSLVLASTGHDVLTSAPGVANVFAIMSFRGTDVIEGFKTGGAVHDVIDFSGRGITSFKQVQAMMSGTDSAILNLGAGKTVTLLGDAPSSLTASDFRYS